MKIVSLLPSATELAGELGVADMLCAISHECDTPPSVLHLPRATGSIIPGGLSQGEINARVAEARAAGEALYTVDGVLIDALSPDLILTQGLCDVCAVTPDTIEASLRGVQCSLPRGTRILSFEGESLEGVRADFFALAELVGMEAAAEAAWARRKAQWDAVAPERSSRRVLLLEWVDPPYSPGHWVPEQIAAAGFVSAIGAPGSHSRPLSMREIRESRPDAIGVISCGFGLEANVRFASELAGRLAAEIGFAGEVAAFDANRCFSRPTFAIVDGADVLYRTFHLGEDVPGMSKRLPGVAGSA
ncbi:MAG: cobalamin-binding protein [Myxococcota bacterium]|nr:cobalamin-binding protein [Myxococcota bacterium]MEC8425636.1 cobalamin-binding protein [Myxococcota bacterium]